MTDIAHAATAPAMPFSQGKKSPIDITADQLEILQNENKAIFTGHVVAIQDDVRLTSEKMVVYYKEQGKGEKAKKDGAAGSSSIDKIEVEQNVFLATPLETAQGSRGLYDVTKRSITLHDNVVLTKDKNTLKGDRLVYDFNTGKSTVSSNGSAPAGTPWKERTRVRALFVPENDDTNAPKDATKKE